MHICKFCGNKFEKGNQLGGHIVRCSLNPNFKKIIRKNKVQKHLIKLKCIVCNNEYEIELSEKDIKLEKYRKTCSNHCAHILQAKNVDKTKKNKLISKSLTRNYCKIKYCENCCKIINTELRGHNTKFCSDECKKTYTSKKISQKIKGKTGGLRINSYKKYKSGWFKNIHCDSSWELAFVIYCLDHNINIERNTQFFEYVYKDKKYKYYPDFIVNNKLYEIKGYESEKDKEKRLQHPNVIVIDKNNISKYLDYVINKYGKNFIELYNK